MNPLAWIDRRVTAFILSGHNSRPFIRRLPLYEIVAGKCFEKHMDRLAVAIGRLNRQYQDMELWLRILESRKDRLTFADRPVMNRERGLQARIESVCDEGWLKDDLIQLVQARNFVMHGVTTVFEGEAIVAKGSFVEFRFRELKPISEELYEEIINVRTSDFWHRMNHNDVLDLTKRVYLLNGILQYFATREEPGKYEMALSDRGVVTYSSLGWIGWEEESNDLTDD